MNHPTTPATKATATKPPTTPPATAPASELLCEVEVGDEPEPVTLGVMVDCETPIVDVGTIETLPVTSGESAREGKMNNIGCVQQKGRAPPTAEATEMFQLSPICEVPLMRFPGQAGKRQREGTHRCIYVCPLRYSSANWDRVREAGLEG